MPSGLEGESPGGTPFQPVSVGLQCEVKVSDDEFSMDQSDKSSCDFGPSAVVGRGILRDFAGFCSDTGFCSECVQKHCLFSVIF